MCGIKEKEIMLFSNKLFIYCSILCLFYPMGKAIVKDQHSCGSVSSPPQTAELVLFTSKLAQLECNWKLRLFKDWRWPKIFVMSRKKSLRFKTIVQGLAVLLLFALSVVMSITFFIAISVTIRFPFEHDAYDIEKRASAIAFLSLSMFQYSVFSQQMNAVNSIVRKPIILALMDTQLKLNCFKKYSSPELEFALVLLLLLCGDVEINPGPQGDGKGDNSTSESVDPGYASISVNEPLSMQIPSDDAAASNNISHTSEHLVSNSVSLTSQNQDYVQFDQEPLEPQNYDVEDESPDLQPIPEAQANALSKPFEESNVPGNAAIVGHLSVRPEFEQNSQAVVEDASSMFVPNHAGATLLKKVVGDTASTPTSSPSKAQMPISTQPEANIGDNVFEKITQDMKDVPRFRGALLDMIENWKCCNIWTETDGFTAEVVRYKEDQYKECGEECYKLLNQLYRRLQGSIICPLCLCKSSSKPKSKSIESHFIPRAMLKVFRDIHGDGVDNFMYNISAGKTLGIGLRCPDMLCSGCENVSSKEEDKLRDVYLGILVETESNILTFKNAPTGWFQFILANIFFRGLLVGCDLKVELNNKLFQDFFWRLKQYCNKENKVFPDIKLYILANKPLNPKMKNFVHALDMLARFPRFTQLIRCETGMFLYCQFDCFHLVAPLDKCSIAHFKQYQNGLGLGSDSEQQVHIPQHGHCEVRKDRDTNILTYYIPAVADGLMYQFPEVLLQINAKDYSRVSPFVIEDQYRKRYKDDSTSTNPKSVSKLTDDVVSFVDRAPDCPPRFNLCTNTPGTNHRICLPNRRRKHIDLQLRSDIILKQTEVAFKLSPIAHYKRLEQLYAEEIEKIKSDQKNVIKKHNRLCRLLFMNELRHAIERRSRDSELVPPSIKEMFDSVSEYGESDKLIDIAKQLIISKTWNRRLSSLSVPWPDESITEIEQATTEYYHSCGILFVFIKCELVMIIYTEFSWCTII